MAGYLRECFMFPVDNLRSGKRSLQKVLLAHIAVVFTWSFVQPYLQKTMVDEIVQGRIVALVMTAIIAVAVYVTMHNIACFVSIRSIKIKSTLRSLLTDRVIAALYSEELKRDRGRASRLISRVNNEPMQLSQLVQFDLEVVGIVASALFSLALCFVISVYAILPFFIIAPIILPLSLRKAGETRKASHRSQQRNSSLVGMVSSALESMDIFSAFRILPSIRRVLHGELHKQQTMSVELGVIQSKVGRDTRITLMVVELVIFISVGVFVTMTHASLGSFFALTSAYWRLNDAFKSIVEKLPTVLTSHNLITRHERFCSRQPSRWFERSWTKNEYNNLRVVDLSFAMNGTAPAGPINVEIHSRGSLAVYGANGSGKSTFLRLLAGDAIDHSGDFSCPTPISVAFSPPKFPPISAYQMLAGALLDDSGKNRVERIAAALNISHKLDEVPSNWSDGEKRRLGVLLALSKRAATYILDEPLSGVDPKSKLAMVELIVRETHGSILVVALHEPEFLSYFTASFDFGTLACSLGTEPTARFAEPIVP